MIITNLRRVPIIHFSWVRGIVEELGYPIESTEQDPDGNFIDIRIATPDSALGYELLRAINQSHNTRQKLEAIYDKKQS